MAIYAIVLHAVLWAIVLPMTASASADPFSAICHSATHAPADQSPVGPAPASVCDHCNVCSAAPAPAALDSILAGQLAPARLLHVLRPASTAPGAVILFRPNLARGPPLFV
jgi:hypothetical protein